MSLLAVNYNFLLPPQPSCTIPAPSFLQTCPADCPQKSYYNKHFSLITQNDWKKAKKIEFYNSDIKQWIEISPRTFGILMDMGLTEKRLEKIGIMWAALVDKNTEAPTLEKFVDDLLNRLGVLFESKKKISNEFWNLIDATTDKRLYNGVFFENNCIIRDRNRPHALILESFHPEDSAFYRDSLFNLHLMGSLDRVYNICTRTFSSVAEFCSKTREMTKAVSTKLLMIKGHGDQNGYGVVTYPDSKHSVSLYSSLKGCFDFLASNATVVINSCKLGFGRAQEFNFANHVANNVPRGTHVIASTADSAIMAMSPEEPPPHSAIFRSADQNKPDFSLSSATTYHIDTAKRSPELCPPDTISPLNLCSEFPLLRLKLIENRPTLYFYSATKKNWSEFSVDAWDFLRDRFFNNGHLEKISKSKLTLSEFVEQAEEYPHSYTASQLIQKIL